MTGCSLLIRIADRKTAGDQPDNKADDVIAARPIGFEWGQEERTVHAVIEVRDLSVADAAARYLRQERRNVPLVVPDDPFSRNVADEADGELVRQRRVGLDRAALRARVDTTTQGRLDNAFNPTHRINLGRLPRVAAEDLRLASRVKRTGSPPALSVGSMATRTVDTTAGPMTFAEFHRRAKAAAASRALLRGGQ